MKISVDSTQVLITGNDGYQRFFIKSIRRTGQKNVILKENKAKRKRPSIKLIAIVIGIALCLGAPFFVPDLPVEPDIAWVLLALEAGLILFLIWAIRLYVKPARTVTLHSGYFVSGEQDIYSLASKDKDLVHGFITAIEKAKADEMTASYTINVDKSIHAKDMKIDTVKSSNAFLVEGDLSNVNTQG